ncbi:ABC transporter permease [Streptomyces sp. NPDC059063]|uniref:ABC transporter permease n=1 Tax=unclassified Streptomyces TaxID=2593676 RepID=UPI0036BEA017
MTTASLTPAASRPPAAARAARASVLPGSLRSVLRLHRTTLWAALALTVLAAAVTSYVRLAAEGNPGLIEPFGLSNTHDLLNVYLSRGAWALLLVPLAVGAFTAGPLVARELEGGLHRFAWSQGDSPARWLAARLTVGGALAVAAGLAVIGVFELGGHDIVHAQGSLRWADPGIYAATGPAVVAYCLLAVAVGTLAGLLVRRTLLAMSATGLVTGAALWLFSSVRWDLVPADTVVDSGARAIEFWWPRNMPGDVHLVGQGVTNAAGERFSPGECLPDPAPGSDCPADLHAVQAYADFHPRSHFWYAQLIETGIVLALTAAAVYASFWILRRRTP